MSRAAVVVPLLKIGLVALSFRAVGTRVLRRAPRGPAPDPRTARELARRTAWAVHAVARRLPGNRCLVEALAVSYLLGAAGVSTGLRIGVRRDSQGAIRAHAWVEHDGRIVIGGSDEAFEPLPLEEVAW